MKNIILVFIILILPCLLLANDKKLLEITEDDYTLCRMALKNKKDDVFDIFTLTEKEKTLIAKAKKKALEKITNKINEMKKNGLLTGIKQYSKEVYIKSDIWKDISDTEKEKKRKLINAYLGKLKYQYLYIRGPDTGKLIEKIDTSQYNKSKLSNEEIVNKVTPRINVSVKQLIEDYKSNKLKADLKYENNFLIINGQIQDVDVNQNGFPYIYLICEKFSFDYIYCSFDKNKKGEIIEIFKGQQIKISGKCYRKKGESLPWLSDCEIIKNKKKKSLTIIKELNIAVTSYELAHGKPITSLQDLVPEFYNMDDLPKEDADGNPYVLKKIQNGSIKIIIKETPIKPKRKEQIKEQLPPKKEKSKSKVKRITVSAKQLSDEYEVNEIKADLKYKGKYIIVYGQIQKIGNDILGKPYITIGDVEGFLDDVQCSFSIKQKFEIAELIKGQQIKICGKCCGGSIGNLILNKCQILK